MESSKSNLLHALELEDSDKIESKIYKYIKKGEVAKLKLHLPKV